MNNIRKIGIIISIGFIVFILVFSCCIFYKNWNKKEGGENVCFEIKTLNLICEIDAENINGLKNKSYFYLPTVITKEKQPLEIESYTLGIPDEYYSLSIEECAYGYILNLTLNCSLNYIYLEITFKYNSENISYGKEITDYSQFFKYSPGLSTWSNKYIWIYSSINNCSLHLEFIRNKGYRYQLVDSCHKEGVEIGWNKLTVSRFVRDMVNPSLEVITPSTSPKRYNSTVWGNEYCIYKKEVY